MADFQQKYVPLTNELSVDYIFVNTDSYKSLASIPFRFCKNQAACKHWDSKINKPQRKACKGNARQLIGESSDKNYGVRTAYSRLGKC